MSSRVKRQGKVISSATRKSVNATISAIEALPFRKRVRICWKILIKKL